MGDGADTKSLGIQEVVRRREEDAENGVLGKEDFGLVLKGRQWCVLGGEKKLRKGKIA